MHARHLHEWTHEHVFHTACGLAERGTRLVTWITLAAMTLELGAGWWFNSMALLADGWHMSSHAMALGLSAFAYAASRRYARDPRFAFGAWKIEILGSFASAIMLLGVAALMMVASLERLWQPQPVHYAQATAVAFFGLLVNLACAGLLASARGHVPQPGHGVAHGHEHQHKHSHGHRHGAGHEDLNLKSAYLHVLADAATSVLAVAALAGGWRLGWDWLDPAVGLVGAAWVAVWAWGLLRQSGCVLLDREMDHPVVAELRQALESPNGPCGTRIADLHVWRVGRDAYACALTLVTHDAQLTPGRVRQRLSSHPELAHATIEIHHCLSPSAPAVP